MWRGLSKCQYLHLNVLARLSRHGATLILSSADCWWQILFFFFLLPQICLRCCRNASCAQWSLLTCKIVCSAFTAFPLGHNTLKKKKKKGSLKVPVLGFRCDSGLVNI